MGVMLLKSLRLENIRSYLNQEIKFDKGSTILSGNVGAGKSTILLAIEFALFGLLRGTVSGDALLRNGKDNGFVELNFDVDGKDIIIKRNLKRSKNVTQDSGSIIINNAEKELGATELKQHVLDILNYPKELLTKSKELVYRYTVYTPQEEMKAILLEKDENRLDILRRVFGIDKYKRIKDNAYIITGKVRDKKRELTAKIEDLGNLKENREKKLNDIESLKANIREIEPKLAKIKGNIESKKTEYGNFEKKIKDITEVKSKIAVLENEAGNKIKSNERNKKESERTGLEIEKLKAEIKNIKFDINLLQDYEKELSALETNIKAAESKASEAETNIKNSRGIIEDISRLDNCPLCKQNVSREHTENVINQEQRKINLNEDELKILRGKQNEITSKINKLKESIKELKEIEIEFRINELRKRNLSEKERLISEIIKDQGAIKIEIGGLNSEIMNLKEKIKDVDRITERYKSLMEEIEKLMKEEKDVEINRASIETKIKDYSDEAVNITKEIEVRLKIKDKIDYLSEFSDYTERIFINIMSVIERKVMLKVHSDFNSFFQKWFSMLMDNDIINVRINEEFSPVIEQAGHEISYEYLSGGEKTACALAYRLALNQIINELMSLIKTRDLIILDEPTDGFSEDQLDRLRNVIEELNAKQIVIVSHESKIESFVQNVLKVEKSEHVSEVL